MMMMRFCWLLCALNLPRFVNAADSSLRGSRQLAAVGDIVALELVNTVTNTEVLTLSEGAVIDVQSLGLSAPSFSVNAVTTGENIGSVQFLLDNVETITENWAKYAMCGNVGPVFNKCEELGYGEHTIKVIPYLEKNAQGETGVPFEMTFSIVEQVTEAPTSLPTKAPTAAPTKAPTDVPTGLPTAAPTEPPTSLPTKAPTKAPTEVPTGLPTAAPTEPPTGSPTTAPTDAPTKGPTESPTGSPTKAPVSVPVAAPVSSPTSPADYAVRINVGGEEYTDTEGNLWLADAASIGQIHGIGCVGDAISETVDDELYCANRWFSLANSNNSPYIYTVPVDLEGDYTVRFHFAETVSCIDSFGLGLSVCLAVNHSHL